MAELCRQGIDEAERELLRRYMQVIYWLPRQAFGASEEVLSDFLLFALEKIRERDILSKYDPARGANFRTWFGVVLRRLYLDYLRTRAVHEEVWVELDSDAIPAPAPSPPPDSDILQRMEPHCRVLFKLLLCNPSFLTEEEWKWLASRSRRGMLELAEWLEKEERELLERNAAIREKYDRLASAIWWKTHYERQAQTIEKRLARPFTEGSRELEETYAKLKRKEEEYHRLVADLAGGGGFATTPYRVLANLLRMKEGTLAAQISRCRAAAVEILAKRREGEG